MIHTGPDLNWVTLHVAVGSAPLASSIPAMQHSGITDVLDLRGEPRPPLSETRGHPELYAGTGIQYHYVPMLDRGGTQPASAYAQGIEIIKSVVDRGGRILVHCAAGQSRSPSMVYAYLRSTGESAEHAWSMVQGARAVARRQYIASAEAAATGNRVVPASAIVRANEVRNEGGGGEFGGGGASSGWTAAPAAQSPVRPPVRRSSDNGGAFMAIILIVVAVKVLGR